ncbi:MAG: hypothetical protein A2527_03260 [Candidatus Lambdaproteobacteria bacterium RIFOXYD2_FULL_50_16]|uniref:Uncharacterized protein n=1 Tax=Candidatus Lambdaproteobacteria bacterium RIFOXYD2_FULL_50_16 TaxID=1817772 RepID=A0A1F6GEQ2_9PROT|nr:MAG: hypothetical protein A2527_03260 [Candidatus Lambdaproteobacteria bacterium RIFOXYD2_FULL_50_16]
MGLLLLSFSGCKELNNHPAPEMVKVDIRGLKAQLGYSSTANSAISGQPASPANDEVKSLLIGALAVTTRSTPYTKDTAITPEVSKNLETELTNSVNFFTLVALPTTKDYIEFKVPPPAAGKWQVIAVGLKTQPEKLGNLSDPEHEDSAAYYGFVESFLTFNEVGKTPYDLSLYRACLISKPPKGCATFDDSLTGTPIVTAAVEIQTILVNDKAYSPITLTLPLIAQTDAEASAAITGLNTELTGIKAAYSSVTSLTIQTTHSKNAGEAAACQAGTYSACQVQSYRVSF